MKSFCNIIYSSTRFFATFTILMVVVPLSKSHHEEGHNVSEIWATTDIKIFRVKYTWTINNLKFCCQAVGEVVRSPTFRTNDGCNWYLDLRPKGADEETKDYVSLFLYSLNCIESAVVKFSVLNPISEQTSIREFSYQFEPPPKNAQGYHKFILLSDLLNPEYNLTSDNKLIIICEISTVAGIESFSGKFAEPRLHLEEDFGRLLENELFSDVTLASGGKKFKAHRAILAARSPVFKSKFEKDYENSLMELTDVEPKVLSELLRYIYTEEISDLKGVTPNLLIAAEEFKLDELKTRCERVMAANLSIKNAVDFYILGEKYRAFDLKKKAEQFIVAHASDIANTNGFKSLVLRKPSLAVEMFKLLG